MMKFTLNGLVEMLKFLGNSARKGFLGSLMAMGVVAGVSAYIGYSWAGSHHLNLSSKISKNTSGLHKQKHQLIQVGATLTIIKNTLVTIGRTFNDVKKTVNKTDARMFQVVQDVATIKAKQK